MGWSQALADLLRDEEAKLAVLKSQGCPVRQSARERAAHPKIIEGYLCSFLALIDGDPIAGGEILARNIQPLVLTPRADGGHDITGGFNVATVIAAEGDALVSDTKVGGTGYCTCSTGAPDDRAGAAAPAIPLV
jgi:hypothetical protein